MNSVDRKDPRVRRTRRLLMNALLGLLTEKSLQSITVSEITHHATLNRATFYLHYTDKFDLFISTARDLFHDTLMDALPREHIGHVEDIKTMVIATCNFVQQAIAQRSPQNKPFEPVIEAQIQEHLQDYLYVWLQSDAMKGTELTTCAKTTATLISRTILGCALRWMREPGSRTPEDVAEQVYRIVMNGYWRVKPEELQQQ
ncbi:MAG: TetR/AcrR family transcriptional regulator [Chloroflexota bacterium]